MELTASTSIPLWDVQQEALTHLRELDGKAGLFAALGAGKTRMSLAFCELNGVHRAIVLAKPTYVRAWEQEIKELMPDLNLLVLPGAGTIARQAATLRAWPLVPGVNLCITHYDGYWREPLRSAILGWQPEAVFADEVHALKHHTSKRSRMAYTIACQAWSRYRIGLTGTPTGSKLELAFSRQAKLHHLFSIMRFIYPDDWNTRWEDFQNNHCIMSQSPSIPIPIIVGYHHVDELVSYVSPRVHFIYKDQLPPRPPITDVPIPIDLDPSTRRAYDELKKFSITKLEGLDPDGQALTGYAISKIAMGLAFKLQQVCCGSIVTDNGVVDISSEKLLAAMSIIEDAIDNTNVVVGCRFRRNVRRVYEACVKAGYKTVVIWGGITKKQRDQALETVATQERVVLVCSLKSTAEGINDLVGCNVAIVYSHDLEREVMMQWHGRFDRPGQERPVTVFHLIATKTVEEEFYRAQLSGIDLSVRTRNLATAKRLLAA